ncbi:MULTISPECIES: large conductance mechanosensitive channel protein MscL [Paenibacillus]|uniref:large conductance mechanosensitive channel protein MscL n=1 Tax=Paenibacillus TaxID=44249 RepID=UPI000E287B87|nr:MULTISPECIES: large conductance mechanosensitive channel protein MscL [Paenibacillus]MCM3000471.1 large conductance mechanosensitive channel protein MscL [Paenibacillus cellulositrophicus]RED34607.1 large conductance mechanosensitive channel [Paenibacillus sp. VMFN-D1]
MKGFIHEFKEFAVRGNVIDLAVGVIVGGAFGKIVSSIVSDIIMPPIGVLLGGVNFSDLIIRLTGKTMKDGSKVNTLAEAKEVGAPVIAYGQFLNTVIDFLIISFCIFLLVKGINWIKNREHEKPEPEKTTKECPYCLSEIPAAATRCAHCTSVLDTDPEPLQA